MGKCRPRVKGKGKRWRKGQSSSSNPDIKKHRDIAKSRFFQDNAGQGDLTSDALKKHDAFLGTKADEPETIADDERTLGGTFHTFQTFQTFASDWSLCSNQSFSKLLHNFRSDSALHKEMLAVLAAITEVIKQNGGTETVTEYFGALMTTLELSTSEDSLSAILALLCMGIKSVPQNVLQKKFGEVSKTFVDLLATHATSENAVVVKSLIGCLSVVLRAQESAIWANSSTRACFNAILAYTTHSKPKVRKAAQHAVCAVLRGSVMMNGENAPAHHPAALEAANFCMKIIETGGALGGSTTSLHTLHLLKEILGTFPKNQLKSVCETILKVMTLGNVLLTSCGMQALHGLFASRPPASTLTPALNAQLLTALHDYQPAQNDTQPTLAWLAVMQEACINLARLDLSIASVHMPRMFTTVSQLWLSEKPEISGGATRCLVAVAQDCVAPLCTKKPISHQYQTVILKVMTTVHAGLQYQYHSAWQQVLHVIATLFEVTGADCPELMKPVLKTLADLRDSYQFTYAHELENAVGKAVKSMGPEAVLEVIPLQITGKEMSYEFRRSWLLPVLKESIRNARLGFFVSYFLPLATECRRKGQACSEQKDMVGAHSYDLLQSQIWSLLPSFCNKPTDVRDSFKNIARVLGTAVKDHKDLRLFVLSALRKLILSARDKTDDEATEDRRAAGHAELNELARFAKNFLPILFNIYMTRTTGTDEEGQRLSAFETIKIYFSITDIALSQDFFDKAFLKLGEEGSDTFVKESILDLLRAMLPYQDMERLSKLFKMCEDGIGSNNHHIQKKAYRMLEEICASDSKNCHQFISQNLASMQSILLTSLSKSATSSKGPRLRCLIHLVKRLDASQMSVLEQIVPEAVLCCKDLNEKCRAAAFTLLTQIGEMMATWLDKPKDDIMRDYVGLLLAGLAGSPMLASATVLALAKITFEFRASLPEDLVLLVLDNICILCTSSTREIVAACLSYIKVFITAFTTEEIGPSVPTIVKGMLCMTDDCKRYLRNKYRIIFDRLVRKFGWKPISDLVPTSDVIMHKRLKNLRKDQERKKKKRPEDNSDSDNENFVVKAKPKSIEEILADSDDSDIETDNRQTKPAKKKNPSAWIQENADDIVDFTDVSAAKKISATNPTPSTSQTKKKKEDKSIKTASDGRLIIVDESDSEDDKTLSKSAWRRNLSDSENEDDKSTVQLTGKRKRKLSLNSDARSEPAMKYQAGGTGIHRPTFKTKSKKSKGPATLTGSEYKSSKASGDVKRKGRPDPFAYVPMSRKLLNKRKKGKPSGQFKHLINKTSKRSTKCKGKGKQKGKQKGRN